MTDVYGFDSEADFRRACQAIKFVEALRRGGLTPSAFLAGPAPDGAIPFVCDTDDVPPGGVLVDDGATHPGFLPLLTATATTTLGERPIYVAAPRDFPAGEPGICYPAGLRPMQVAYDDTDGTPAAGETWGPVDGQFTIRKGFPGFHCLLAGDSGLVWAIPDAADAKYIGKLTEALASGSVATTTVYKWTGSAYATASFTAEVYASPLLTSGSVAINKMVAFRWDSAASRLVLDGREC